MKAKINSFWSMLDDMAQNDPQAYKSFVSSNIEKGVNEKKKEKEKQELAMRRKFADEDHILRIVSRLETKKKNKAASDPIDPAFSRFLIENQKEEHPDGHHHIKSKKEPSNIGKLLINLVQNEEY